MQHIETGSVNLPFWPVIHAEGQEANGIIDMKVHILRSPCVDASSYHSMSTEAVVSLLPQTTNYVLLELSQN
jgi:hypothetical protein